MKLQVVIKILLASLVLGACSPKVSERFPHEGKKEWTPQEAPIDLNVSEEEFLAIDLNAKFKNLESKDLGLVEEIMFSLKPFVLNSRFIENTKFNTARMGQAVNLFNRAYFRLLSQEKISQKLLEVRASYLATIFSGCSRDLKSDCYHLSRSNTSPLLTDNWTSPLLVRLVRINEDQIEAELARAKGVENCVKESQTCRNLIEERYKILAAAMKTQRVRTVNPEFSFAYMKYARAFASLTEYWKARSETAAMANSNSSVAVEDFSLGYLNDVHGKVFESMIAKYNPKDIKDPEFSEFVENFNPWQYSSRKSDIFRHGIRKIFSLAAQCCIYSDPAKTKLSPSFVSALTESQTEKDETYPSLRQIIEQVQNSGNGDVLTRLGLAGDAAKILSSSGTLDETFYVVDRLYRGHLETSEANMILRQLNQAKVRRDLSERVALYARFQLLNMIDETNRFMAGIYNTKGLPSDKMFEMALTESRYLSSRWLAFLSRMDLLNKFVGSYFKSLSTTDEERKSYEKVNQLVQGLNRNIHYLSIYPNMYVLNYYLVKMKGSISISVWWRKEPIQVDAGTVLNAFFSGGMQPWLKFGEDSLALPKEMILYSLYYGLKTNTFETFVRFAEEGGENNDFFSQIFSKYIEETLRGAEEQYLEIKRNALRYPTAYALADQMCSYETGFNLDGVKVQAFGPRVDIPITQLAQLNYSGFGSEGVSTTLASLLTSGQELASEFRGDIDEKVTYLNAMISIVESHLLKTGKIEKLGQSHKDLDQGRALIKSLEKIKNSVLAEFVGKSQKIADCMIHLKEVERRRANRLYEEERKYLGWVHDIMAPLNEITDGNQLLAKGEELNKTHFKGKSRFDGIDGRSYVMSRFDLYMRMKERIEKDVFLNPLDEETKVYGDSLGRYLKPRRVSVYIPPGIEEMELVRRGRADGISFEWVADKNEFIRKGMSALSGTSDALIRWAEYSKADLSLENYLSSMIEFYLLSEDKTFRADSCEDKACEQSLALAPRDLVDVYLKMLSSYTMDAFDVKNYADFSRDGKKDRSFFDKLFVEENTRNSIPLFEGLMRRMYADSGIRFETAGHVGTAFEVAKTLNNIFTLIFEPDESLKTSLAATYGDRANRTLRKVKDLFSYIQGLEKDASAHSEELAVMSRPIFIENGQAFSWDQKNAGLVFDQGVQDLNYLIDDFSQRTGDLFGTRKALSDKGQ